MLIDAAKAGALKFRVELFGREEKPERFAGRGNAGRECVKGRLSSMTERVARHAIVEADAGTMLQASNGFERSAESFKREIGNHAEPTEERGRLGVESCPMKAFGQGHVFEIERNEGERGGNGDGSFGEQRALPLLRGGKIDFEDAERRKWIAIGEGVKARAENDVLRDTLRHSLGETVFRIAAAHGHKGTKGACEWLHFLLAIVFKACAEKRDSDWIVENRRLVEDLMDGAAAGHAECSLACATSLHSPSVQVARIRSGESSRARMLIAMSWTSGWIGWALLSAVFAAATALLAKVGVAHVDSNLATALRTSVVVVFAWGIAITLGKHGEVRSLDRRTLLFLALSGIATGLSWLCYFRALQLGPASRVAPLDKLSVPLVMVFAWLLLGEKLSAAAIVGGVLITAGAVVMVLA